MVQDLKIDGKNLYINGSSKNSNDHEAKEFVETFEKNIETPEIILKKYREMNK